MTKAFVEKPEYPSLGYITILDTDETGKTKFLGELDLSKLLPMHTVEGKIRISGTVFSSKTGKQMLGVTAMPPRGTAPSTPTAKVKDDTPAFIPKAVRNTSARSNTSKAEIIEDPGF